MNYRKILFMNEVHKIKDPYIKEWTKKCIDLFPDYFWTAPASGTGLYHEEEENLEGGLVLHTRRLIKLTLDLADYHDLTEYETDILISAAILHDSHAKGLYKRHPKDSTDVFHPLYPSFAFPYHGFSEMIPHDTYNQIMECVYAHSGKFSVVPALNVDKKLPNILKMADFVASRRYIKISI